MLDHDTDSYYKISSAFVDGKPSGNLTRDQSATAIRPFHVDVWEVGNVIGALHSSGVAALADAAALAAVLSLAPDEELARRFQPLGVQARLTFRRPVRGVAVGTCELDGESRAAVHSLFEGLEDRARFTTVAIIDGEASPAAAQGEFDWVARLAPA